MASKNAIPSRNAAAMLTQASSAVTRSSMMWLAHMATRRVEMGRPEISEWEDETALGALSATLGEFKFEVPPSATLGEFKLERVVAERYV